MKLGSQKTGQVQRPPILKIVPYKDTGLEAAGYTLDALRALKFPQLSQWVGRVVLRDQQLGVTDWRTEFGQATQLPRVERLLNCVTSAFQAALPDLAYDFVGADARFLGRRSPQSGFHYDREPHTKYNLPPSPEVIMWTLGIPGDNTPHVPCGTIFTSQAHLEVADPARPVFWPNDAVLASTASIAFFEGQAYLHSAPGGPDYVERASFSGIFSMPHAE